MGFSLGFGFNAIARTRRVMTGEGDLFDEIPAYAGMTKKRAEMTKKRAEMTKDARSDDEGCARA